MLLRVLLLGVAVVLAGCSVTEPVAEPPASWDVELSTAPTLLALTADDAYAASYGNGVGGSQVYRVDRGVGRLVAQRTLAGEPTGMTIGPDGELWLSTRRLPDQVAGTGIQVLDPETLQTWRRLPVRDIPLSIAFHDGQLWSGDASGVHRLDPETGEVLGSVPTQVRPYRLHTAGSALVAVGPEGLQRVDVANGTAAPARRLVAGGSVNATTAGDLLWVVHPDDQDRSVLQRYDAGTLAPGPAADSPGRAGALAYLSEGVLWVTDPDGDRLICADPQTGRPREVRPLPLTGPVVADARSVVVSQQGGLAARPSTCGGAV